jgi:hypothetical protein
MDIESLKKIELACTIKQGKPGSFFSRKRKKSKPPKEEEIKKNKIDMRA